MVRNLIVEIELAEPAIGKVQRHLLAQPPFMTNAIAVTNQEHPDHQLGIDRGSADVAVKRLQLFVQIAQNGCREHVDPSQQVVRRDHLVEAKLVAADLGPAAPSSPNLLPPLKQESLFARLLNPFFDSIDPFRKFALARAR